MDDIIFLEPRNIYDTMIVGVVNTFEGNTCLAYDKDKIIKHLMDDFSSTLKEEEQEDLHAMAVEFFDFNIAGAYLGANTPIYVSKEEVEFIEDL